MKHHILHHKSQQSSNHPSAYSPLHPSQVKISQKIIRAENNFENNINKYNTSTVISRSDHLNTQKVHENQTSILEQSAVKEFRLGSRIVQIGTVPTLGRVQNAMTTTDKVRAINRDSGYDSSRYMQEVTEQIQQFSPMYDNNMQNNQGWPVQEQQLDANGWPIEHQQQQAFFQTDMNPAGSFMNNNNNNGWGENGFIPEQPPPNMGAFFGQMIAQGTHEQVNPMMGSLNNMNPGNQMNQSQGNFMNSSNQMNMNSQMGFGQNFMPPQMSDQNQVPPFMQNFAGGMQQSITRHPNMMGSVHDSMNFSQASELRNQNPFQHPNAGFQQNSIPPPPFMNDGQNPFQQNPFQQNHFQQNPMPGPQLGVSPQMMQFAGALNGLFAPPPERAVTVQTNSLNASRTGPLAASHISNHMNHMAQSIQQNNNIAQSIGFLMNQSQPQEQELTNYSYRRPPPQLITCVICKQTYDVQNTKQHVQRHKSWRAPPVNEVLHTALAGTVLKPKTAIPKPPIIRPIVEPEQCVLSPQGNTYIIQRIHRLEGQNLDLLDNFPPPIDPPMSVHNSLVANRMSPTIPGGFVTEQMYQTNNFFPNSYEPQGFPLQQQYPIQQQFQAFPNMGGSQIRNSQIRNSQMRASQNRNSQFMPMQSSSISDFSYNYLGDQIPQPPQTGVVAAQKMRIPRQILEAWRTG